MADYPNYYHSKEDYEHAQEFHRKLKEEIETALIENAPTEEIRMALLKGTGRVV